MTAGGHFLWLWEGLLGDHREALGRPKAGNVVLISVVVTRVRICVKIHHALQTDLSPLL
jgi:hypothetical protein